MKVKLVAASSMAAVFTFTSMASILAHGQVLTQYQPGLGYGGNAPCGYTQVPAPAVSNSEDELSDLLATRRTLKARYKAKEKEIGLTDAVDSKTINGRLNKLRGEIEQDFDSHWSTVFLRHMDGQMNCDICGASYAPVGQPETSPGGTSQTAPPPYVQSGPPSQNSQQSSRDPKDDPNNNPTQGTVVQVAPAPAGSDARPPVVRRVPNKPTSMDDGNGADAVDMATVLKECKENHPSWFSNPKKNPKLTKALKDNTAESNEKIRQACASGRAMTSNDAFSNGRVPASVGGGRMPASLSEVGHNGGQRPPVSSSSDVGNTDDGSWYRNVPLLGTATVGGGGGGPSKCYNRKDGVYNSRVWQEDICMAGGHLNPEVCRAQGIVQGTPNFVRCQSALQQYLALATKLDIAQAQLRELDQQITIAEQDIQDWHDEHDGGDSEDDKILAARDQRQAYAQAVSSSARSGPSFGQSLMAVGAGLVSGYGAYSLINGPERRDYNANNAALTALGWQTLPYHSDPAAVGAGLSVFKGVTGALLSSYGCGQTYNGVNGNIFGSSSGPNGYQTAGGGMYNGCGSWGCAGPNGGGAGFQFNAGAGAGYYDGAGQYGVPGYGYNAGVPGYGNGVPGYGYNNGYPGAGAGIQFGVGAGVGYGNGVPGQYGIPGYGYNSGIPGYGNYGIPGYQNGSPYGVGGTGSYFPGAGGYPYGANNAAYLYQLEQARNQANAQGTSIQYSQILGQMSQAQQQLQYLQSSSYNGYYNGYNTYNGYNSYYPSSYSYSSYLPYSSSYQYYVNPLSYSNSSFLQPTTPAYTVPTNTR